MLPGDSLTNSRFENAVRQTEIKAISPGRSGRNGASGGSRKPCRTAATGITGRMRTAPFQCTGCPAKKPPRERRDTIARRPRRRVAARRRGARQNPVPGQGNRHGSADSPARSCNRSASGLHTSVARLARSEPRGFASRPRDRFAFIGHNTRKVMRKRPPLITLGHKSAVVKFKWEEGIGDRGLLVPKLQFRNDSL
jgi:hypothetical protein